jgi:hypothetical protein
MAEFRRAASVQRPHFYAVCPKAVISLTATSRRLTLAREFLETALFKERRIEERKRTGREPSPVEPSREHMDLFNEAAKKPIDLTAEFAQAAGSGEGGTSGDSAQNSAPEAEITIQRRRRTRDRSQDADRPVGSKPTGRNTDDPSDSDPTPRRRRNPDLDRER